MEDRRSGVPQPEQFHAPCYYTTCPPPKERARSAGRGNPDPFLRRVARCFVRWARSKEAEQSKKGRQRAKLKGEVKEKVLRRRRLYEKEWRKGGVELRQVRHVHVSTAWSMCRSHV